MGVLLSKPVKQEIQTLVDIAILDNKDQIIYENGSTVERELEEISDNLLVSHGIELFWKHQWVSIIPTYPYFPSDFNEKVTPQYSSRYDIRIIYPKSQDDADVGVEIHKDENMTDKI